MGLFSVMDIAAGGMAVTQGGVRVTSHNIANVGNPDYTRQRQVVVTAHPIPSPDGHLGMGVEQETIQRMNDEFVTRQLQHEATRNGSLATQARALQLLETTLNEQSGEGLGAALSDFYDSLRGLASASAPGAPSERAAVLASAQSLVDTFHTFDAQLRDQQADADRAVVEVLPRINSVLGRIQDLNQEIALLEVTAPANDLRDQRDAAVGELARMIDIHTFEQRDGSLVVLHASTGLSLVEGQSARRLVAQADPTHPFDATFSRIFYDDGSLLTDITGTVGSGELGGYLRARDTIVGDVIRDLDSVAMSLVESVNAVHNAGFGLGGATGDFFAPLAATDDAAASIALDPNVAGNQDNIAAALSPTGDATDNRNALALADLRAAAAATYVSGDASGAPSGPVRTLVDHYSTVVADLGQEGRTTYSALDQSSRILEDLNNRRDEVAGVSLDEEVTELVRLQAAFQANARIINAVNEMLDQVIALL